MLKRLFGRTAKPAPATTSHPAAAPPISVTVTARVTEPSRQEREQMAEAMREAYRRDKQLVYSYVIEHYDNPWADLPSEGSLTACPSCGSVFDKPLARSRKCPECSAKIVVRTVDGTKHALTESGAARLDNAKQVVATFNKYRKHAANLEIGTATLLTKLDELRAENPGFTIGDAFWRLANNANLEAMRTGDLQRSSRVLFTQALCLHEEGRDWLNLKREANKRNVQHYLQPGIVTKLRILADGCCDECQQYAAGIGHVAPAVALERLLPGGGCSRDWCNCSWNGAEFSGISI